MKDQEYQSYMRAGRNISIVAGVVFILVSIGIAVDPLGLAFGYDMDFLLKIDITISVIWRLLFAVIGLLNISFSISVGKLILSKDATNVALVNWVVILGIASGIISAMNWIHYVHIATLYQTLAKSGWDMTAIRTVPAFPIDSFYFFSFGGLGIFMVISNTIGVISNQIKKSLGVWGIITGVCSMFVFISYAFDFKIPLPVGNLSLMIVFGGLTGGILGPVYYFRISKVFKKELD